MTAKSAVKRIAIIALIAASMRVQAQMPKSLDEVHTIFVDSLGGSTSGMTQSNIINRLSASQRFQVTLDRDKADAVMAGSVAPGGILNQNVVSAIRLASQDGRVLWAFNGTGKSSSALAEKIVKELLKAATPSEKKVGN